VATTGRAAGGFTLYVKNGKPVYEYNLVSLQRTKITSPKILVPGKNVVRVEFRYDGGGIGKGATVSNSVRETVRAVEGLILDGGEYATIAQVALLLTGF